MQLSTRHFGIIDIDERDIIHFPEGIPGFEDVKSFALIGSQEENSPFQWLQGVENTNLAFVIINPQIIKPDYVVDVDDEKVVALDIKDTEKVLVYSIVVIPEDISKITANLRAPVLINTENNRGKQVIIDNSSYPVKFYIIEELRKIGGQK